MHVAARSLDDDGVAWVRHAGCISDLPHGRDPKRTRDDRYVRVGSSFF